LSSILRKNMIKRVKKEGSKPSLYYLLLFSFI